MSYTALYRKFRPTRFDDVKGQDHIVTTLKNQMKADRIGHAYLFCGTRGTGKTSVAKILAKAVNCSNPTDGSPCNICATCQSIQNQTSMNVIEIDAASNNGVDNIREIVEEVQYSPSEGKYKVYIIDEVHMLSTGAFNALLKTLEEPPSYVIFILATTEAHKIPITILSRCQRYDFRRITIQIIAQELADFMQREKVEAEPKALQYVAKLADGSMRDALSLLDQCIAFYFEEMLTYDRVLEVLGTVDIELFLKMYQYLAQMAVVSCIELLEELVIAGKDLAQFVTEFTWFFRNLLLIKTSNQSNDIIDMSTENYELLKQEAQTVDADTLMRYIRIFSELSNQLKYASQKRVLVEVALIKLCQPEMETNYDSILQRIKKMEKQLEEGIPVRSIDKSLQKETKKPEATTEIIDKTPLPVAIPKDLEMVSKNWDQIKNCIDSSLTRSYLKDEVLSIGNNNELLLVFEDKVAQACIDTEAHKKEIEKAIESKINKKVVVKTKYREPGIKQQDIDITKIIKMEIEYED